MLQEQISYLQQSTSQHSNSRGSQISSPASSSATDQLAQTTANVARSTPAPSVSREEIEYPLSPRSELQQHQKPPPEPTLSNVVSAMGAAIPDICDIRSPDEYYGQSSLVSFIQQCTHTSANHKSGPGPTSRSTQPITPSTLPTTLTQCPPQCYLSRDFLLPQRRVADWLVGIYFKTSHMFYPWVHKESFMTYYEQLWSSNDEEPPNDLPDVGVGGPGCSMEVFHCALNAIFAIACEFSNMPVKEKQSSSLMFYDRMKSLMNIDILDSGNLGHVQALLLVSLYLQCTPYPRRCWNAVGMAYRISVGIGLHLSQSCDDLTPLEREIRWRVCMTMGRPRTLPQPVRIREYEAYWDLGQHTFNDLPQY
ncbi:hypothetical protein EIK77_010645 [Talaromyces pinophilus]|nr:hypothetical protein EIK77_010645 [Talaromyces pinophilus]